MTAATPEDSQSNALLEVQKLLAAGRQDAAIELLQAALADDHGRRSLTCGSVRCFRSNVGR